MMVLRNPKSQWHKCKAYKLNNMHAILFSIHIWVQGISWERWSVSGNHTVGALTQVMLLDFSVQGKPWENCKLQIAISILVKFTCLWISPILAIPILYTFLGIGKHWISCITIYKILAHQKLFYLIPLNVPLKHKTISEKQEFYHRLWRNRV